MQMSQVSIRNPCMLVTNQSDKSYTSMDEYINPVDSTYVMTQTMVTTNDVRDSLPC